MFTSSYLDGAGLVFVIFCVGLQVINVNSRKARDEQLQLLLGEDGNQPLGDDLIETLKEGRQLFTYCTCKKTDEVRVLLFNI